MSARLHAVAEVDFNRTGDPQRLFDPPEGQAMAVAESKWVAHLDVTLPSVGDAVRHPAVVFLIAEQLRGRGGFASFDSDRLLSVSFAVAANDNATRQLVRRVTAFLSETLRQEIDVVSQILDAGPPAASAPLGSRALRLVHGGVAADPS